MELLRSLWSHFLASERRWHESNADTATSDPTLLPPSLSLLILVLGLATLFAGGCAIGWW